MQNQLIPSKGVDIVIPGNEAFVASKRQRLLLLVQNAQNIVLHILCYAQFGIHLKDYVLFLFNFLPYLSVDPQSFQILIWRAHTVWEKKKFGSAKPHLQVSLNISSLHMYVYLIYKTRSILLNGTVDTIEKMLQNQQPNSSTVSDDIVIPGPGHDEHSSPSKW